MARPGVTRREKPFLWVTWVAGILAGTQQCTYPAWYRGHFKAPKRQTSFDLEAWALDHDRLVLREAEHYLAGGWTVAREKENSFYLHGQSAILAGQPDLIATKEGAAIRVIDAKTGDPSRRDFCQVLIYLVALPLAWKRPTLRVSGELVYASGNRLTIDPEEVAAPIRDDLFRLLRTLAADTPPSTVPNRKECAWCDLADCKDRWQETELPATTLEF